MCSRARCHTFLDAAIKDLHRLLGAEADADIQGAPGTITQAPGACGGHWANSGGYRGADKTMALLYAFEFRNIPSFVEASHCTLEACVVVCGNFIGLRMRSSVST